MMRASVRAIIIMHRGESSETAAARLTILVALFHRIHPRAGHF